MNADEGEAAGLFAVKKDSDFTDLLLRAVTDTRDTDGLADLVHGFAGKLGRRAELTAERDFTAGSLDLPGAHRRGHRRRATGPAASTPAANAAPAASASGCPPAPAVERDRAGDLAAGSPTPRPPSPTPSDRPRPAPH